MEPLSNTDYAGPEFLDLLREAVGVNDQALQTTIATELPFLSVIGIREAGVVVAFAAFDSSRDQLVLEYIAVERRMRSAGYGRSLIQHIREQRPAKELFAETDDDAVEFYRPSRSNHHNGFKPVLIHSLRRIATYYPEQPGIRAARARGSPPRRPPTPLRAGGNPTAARRLR